MDRSVSKAALSAILLIGVSVLSACSGSSQPILSTSTFRHVTERTTVKVKGAESVFATETITRTTPRMEK